MVIAPSFGSTTVTNGSSGACMFEDAFRLGKRCLHVAAAQAEIERHIGVGAADEMFEIGECAGGLERVVHNGRGRQGRQLVEDGRKLLVLCCDKRDGLLGQVRIFGQHDRDRLADIAHFLMGEDRLVMKCRPIVRIRNYVEHVLDRDHAENARELAGGTRVDLADAAMRDGAAENLPVQHSRRPKIV
jgi:hypothetical protein